MKRFVALLAVTAALGAPLAARAEQPATPPAQDAAAAPAPAEQEKGFFSRLFDKKPADANEAAGTEPAAGNEDEASTKAKTNINVKANAEGASAEANAEAGNE